jgi:hypothetical protein
VTLVLRDGSIERLGRERRQARKKGKKKEKYRRVIFVVDTHI